MFLTLNHIYPNIFNLFLSHSLSIYWNSKKKKNVYYIKIEYRKDNLSVLKYGAHTDYQTKS